MQTRSGLWIWHDESGNIPPHHTLRISPLSVPCPYCGAERNQSCLVWRRKGTKKYQVKRSKPHPDRNHKAKLISAAADALQPRE